MRLSFVIPAHNEEAYISECLDSILLQISEDATGHLRSIIEIIVVNNASTDRTRQIALLYPGVQVVDEPRKGLPAARQAGFAASRGSLIAHVDADSRLTPNWIAKVLAAFDAEPELAGFSGPIVYYDLNPWQRVSVHVFYLVAFASYALNRYVLRVGSMLQGGNFVTSRKALEAIGGFDLNISFYGEDTDVARRLNEVGKVHFTFGLKMFSSARRLKREGMLTMAARYSLNYFWTTFFKRPYTRTHIDIREQHEG